MSESKVTTTAKRIKSLEPAVLDSSEAPRETIKPAEPTTTPTETIKFAKPATTPTETMKSAEPATMPTETMKSAEPTTTPTETMKSAELTTTPTAPSMTADIAVKPVRTRKAKQAPPPNYLAQFDQEVSPHLHKMSPSWQRLYAAISKATKH